MLRCLVHVHWSFVVWCTFSVGGVRPGGVIHGAVSIGEKVFTVKKVL